MNLLWYARRLRRMTPAEVLARSRDASVKLRWRRRQVRDMARASYPGLPLHLVARNQFRSIHKVGRLTLPKLFIHGGADERVPPALGRRLYEAAAEPKELYVVPGAGHSDVHRRGGLRYLRRLARFRTRCLRAARRPESSGV